MEDFQKNHGIWDWDLQTWIDTSVPVSLQTLQRACDYLNNPSSTSGRFSVQVRSVEIEYKSGR